MLSVEELLSNEFSPAQQSEIWQTISDYYCHSENSLVDQLLISAPKSTQAQQNARNWIEEIRSLPHDLLSVNDLMSRFGLNSDEGIALLSLAEALLRIPDADSAESLIEDKLERLIPEKLLSDPQIDLIGNTTLWGIALSQQLISTDVSSANLTQRLIQKLGNQSVHKAISYAMKILGNQFVFAETIQDALRSRCDYSIDNTAFSFDMLGEAAICDSDVDYYFKAYLEAIQAAGEQNHDQNTSISIKLSALHPRLENAHLEEIQRSLFNRLLQLLATARQLDIAITIDAEESERLELSLLIFEQLLRSELCSGWGKLGLAVQAYSKRALPVLRWLSLLAEDCDTQIPVRLVKGAYWDSEIKKAQQAGIEDYPVYTSKSATDLSYLICSRFLLSAQSPLLLPQFATHNALSIAQILETDSDKSFEFQRLHGMGDSLYALILRSLPYKCRIYAPIGNQSSLLPYLVRRLLENGANSSFVFQINDSDIPLEEITRSPQEILRSIVSPVIKKPNAIYLPVRDNSQGENLGSLDTWEAWKTTINHYKTKQWYCQPIIDGEISEGVQLQPIYPSYQLDRTLGYYSGASIEQIKQALSIAEYSLPQWRNSPLSQRCDMLRTYAQTLQNNKAELTCLLMYEAGKTLRDALNEIREAIDFCYYYANLAEQSLHAETLVSVTGEKNTLSYQGQGTFLCISPWNFPLAIFTGQIAAALVCGNTVIAKPASVTSLIAFRATELWYTAGLPGYALQLLPFQRGEQAEAVLKDSRIAGVAFTGSTQTAMALQQQLASRGDGAISKLIAETGGINAMIADSTALPEQVILDVIQSAFNSAGQRCSALRVLYVQEDIAEQIERRLVGAMDTLVIGSPEKLNTDIGPVINKAAMDRLFDHIELCRAQNKLIHELPLQEQHNQGYFVPPTLIKLHSIDELPDEVFGPVLHIIRYAREDIDRVINEINRSGYGLTFGIHSRNDHFINKVIAGIEAGNIYINRDQVGAIVGSQPFGGIGLSGTGPKAGGPNYLKSFSREMTVSRNTTAQGGNRELLSRKS
ncbi:bifunctional proline dehydrogenase/L-glutamate gamma-semialdehyde dehydrogenase PutA [Neptuniibacter caesariensis]|uniref:Bifunctional protein PutA n=1 Tax=Neptuniibacter caesariensis TaxID=207954 RepID=A0A7U8C3T4_NEPCE|nr:bifunctional proline dehydrogenase/L-glutamate gamma-semialdehyde dehydrogenase PutA [Neptuniibacter caesariensis]EAR60962.1 proline dehydrogenase PutA [Oceanospirillum sp. MED92] [Neptuniibacter caesariensis]